MNIEKAFDLLDHIFVILVLEKMALVNILLRDQESYVINGGTTSRYLLLGRSSHESDPNLKLWIRES